MIFRYNNPAVATLDLFVYFASYWQNMFVPMGYFSLKKYKQIYINASLLRGLTIDSIVQNFFFPEALTRKSKTIAYMEHLL